MFIKYLNWRGKYRYSSEFLVLIFAELVTFVLRIFDETCPF